MIRFDRKQRVVAADHAVPRAVRLIVSRIGMYHWMECLIGAEVRHFRPRFVRMNFDHRIARPKEPVGATRSRQESEELTVDEFHVGNTARQASALRTGLARWQMIHHRMADTIRSDSRDSR